MISRNVAPILRDTFRGDGNVPDRFGCLICTEVPVFPVPPQDQDCCLAVVNVDVTGDTITLDMASRIDRMFNGVGDIDGPRTWALANEANGLVIPAFSFNITGLYPQTMPSNFKMSDARWDSVTKIWTPVDIGQYCVRLIYNGSWLLIIDQNSGPFS